MPVTKVRWTSHKEFKLNIQKLYHQQGLCENGIVWTASVKIRDFGTGGCVIWNVSKEIVSKIYVSEAVF